MISLFLYLMVVLFWGASWFVTKLHIPHADPEVSLFYRVVLSSIVLLGLCRFKKLSLSFSFKEHINLFLIGMSLFAFQVLLGYKAGAHLVSGCVAVLFSFVSVFNVAGAFFLLKKKPSLPTIRGVSFGLLGVVVFFWSDLSTLSSGGDVTKGFVYVLSSALLFSLGNILSSRGPMEKKNMIAATTISTLYASVALFIYCLWEGVSFTFPTSASYWGSLSFLTLFVSVAGFLGYLALIARIGPEKTGYSTILAPIVALIISVWAEDYAFSWNHFLGMGFVVMGSLAMSSSKQPLILKKESKVVAETSINSPFES